MPEIERVCPDCGHVREEDALFCKRCGRPFQATQTPDPTPDSADMSAFQRDVLRSNVALEQRAREDSRQPSGTNSHRVLQSPWLIGALVVVTFGIYGFWWLGYTWAQIKTEDGDPKKSPLWHALAMLVPIYGYFRFHAHMRAIAALNKSDEGVGFTPTSMTLAWIVVNVMQAVAARLESAGWTTIVAIVLLGALLAWAQRGLNITWTSLPGGGVQRRVHPLQWLLLLGMGVVFVLAALGAFDTGALPSS